MKKFFSFEGRIRRTEYFATNVVAVLAFWVIFAMCFSMGALSGADAGIGLAAIVGMMGYIVMLWVLFAAGAKRCHDRGNSGFFQLIPFYSLWMLFGDGEHGSNGYGPDPKNRINAKDLHKQTA